MSWTNAHPTCLRYSSPTSHSLIGVVMTCRASGFSMAVITLAVACQVHSHTVSPTAAVVPKWCTQPGRLADSVFMIDQARVALNGPDTSMALKPDSVARVNGGLVVRMLPVKPILGGGGLVWIDLETACTMVLRRFE